MMPRRQRSDFNLSFVLAALERAQAITAAQRGELLTKEAVLRARLMRERAGGRPYDASPIELVVASGLVSLDEEAICQLVAPVAGVRFRKIDPLKLDMQLITRTLSRPYAERHVALVLERSGDRLVVAVANPFDRELHEMLRQLASSDVELVLASKTEILKSIEDVYGFKRSVAAVADVAEAPGGQLGDFEQLVRLSSGRELDANDRPVVAAVEYLLRYAFEHRASDIHLEPRRGGTDVRLRIDGVLHRVYALPRGVHAPLLSRLKGLARMDIAEKRRPQDGRIKTERNGREVELRLSMVPTAFGEKAVLRVFDPEALAQDLQELGFFADELAVFEQWIARPHGMVLVTGPTGSGKTTTLYSALRALATTDVNITTIEDPIEMVLDGLNQIQVQPKIDLDFAGALRHVLRQDPDIIMVGEIRDRETAAAAVQSALTGHLVFSTLHTNGAVEAVSRLRDLGVEPFLIASCLVGSMAQRLVRSVCPHCARDVELTDEERAALGVELPGEVHARRGTGCVKCRQTGYLGRTAIFELANIDSSVRTLISDRAPAEALLKAVHAQPGAHSLREAGARKVALGVTTVEEVVRATER